MEVMEAFYDAISRGDLDGMLAVCHPEIEFHSLIAEAEGGDFRGDEGVRDWWASVIDSLGVTPGAEEIESFRDRGITRMSLAGKIEGVEFPQSMWMGWRVKDGRVIWWQTFRTEDEALASVGLS
jgi:ketosteroid isomerase-like protein